MIPRRLLAVAALAVFACFAARPIPAQEANIDIADLKLGFGGLYKIGHWTPAEVVLRSIADEAANGSIAVRTIDGDGCLTAMRLAGVTVNAGRDTTMRTLIKVGRPDEPIEVTFDSSAAAATRTFPLAPKPEPGELPAPILATQELIVEIGRPIGLERLERQYSGNDLARTAVAQVENLGSLPADWLGYEGVDLAVLTTSDPARNELWRQDGERLAALDRWVRLGGKLVFCVGREGATVLAADSPLARFAPGRFERIVERGPAAWESFAAALAEPMQSADGGPPAPIAISKLADVRGRIELFDGRDVPAVIRSSYGFGEVLFVAADLDRPPFSTWAARTKLALRLLGKVEPSPGERLAAANTGSVRLGYSDLSGQLRAALSQFEGAAMIPFWLFFCLALAYAAAIFPVEFFLARWVRPRFEAAWVLFPLILAAGAGGAWWIASAWKGELPLINKAESVDIDLAGGLARGHTWLGLYTPTADAYDLDLAVNRFLDNAPATTWLSWLGLPGEGLGGMNSQTAASQPFDTEYDYDGGRLAGVPLAAWSSKTFEADWQATMNSDRSELHERSTDHQPLGFIDNKTGMALNECVLFYEGWSYVIGNLAPGDRVDVSRIQRLQTIESYLIGRRAVGDKELSRPYDPQASDPEQILRAIMFHEAAGGRQYTSLLNRVYHRLDATPALRLGRAVVVARSKSATSIRVSSRRGQAPQLEDDVTFYRFLIPVNRGLPDERGGAVALRVD